MAGITGNFPTVNYSQIRNSLKTGDVITFQGTSSLDWMIQLVEGEPFNHVGMVYRDGDNLYFWDAPGGGNQFPDPFKNNQPHPGCRVAPLDALLDYYMSKEVSMFLRQIQPALTADKLGALDIFINLADGLPFPGQEVKLPFEINLGAGLATSFFAGNEFKITFAGSYFCAHLIAETYMHLGLLPVAPFPANSYSPADFDSTDATQLPLTAGNTLSATVQVIYNTQAAPTAAAATAQY